MSAKAGARLFRIDNRAIQLTNRGTQVAQMLSELADEVNSFAAFMHNNPRAEIEQSDRDAYSTDFVAVMTAIQTALAKLNDLGQVEAGAMTVENFLANHVQATIDAYSNSFDKA